ncbi:MAG: hypothetical protein K5694_01765 [Bacilli bacterium]|nr:hypothetical protein [Bacilli bacterium]
MKKSLSLLIISSMMILASCGGSTPAASSSLISSEESASSKSEQTSSSEVSSSETTSEESSSEESSIEESSEVSSEESSLDPNAVPVAEILANLEAWSDVEGKSSNIQTVEDMDMLNEYIKLRTEERHILSDKTSYANGTYSVTNGDESDPLTDTFQSRVAVQTDKIKNGGVTYSYPMLYDVTDYQNESLPGCEDEATKCFVVESELEAAHMGLSEGEYVLKDEVDTYASLQIAATTHDWIAVNFVANPYASQLGDIYFHKDGNTYRGELRYQVTDSDDGWNVTTMTAIIATLTVDDTNRLVGTKTSYITYEYDNDDEENVSYHAVEYTGAIAYGEREETAETIDVNDYFLNSITSIAIMDRYKKEYPFDQIPLNATYIDGVAKTYLPEKALNVTLTAESSSDTSVITLDNGSLKVVNPGTTTLTFSYYGKNEEGVFTERTIEQEVTVIRPAVESIRLEGLAYASPAIHNETVYIGTNYAVDVYITPSKASRQFSVSSSNEEAIQVSVNDNNQLVITPVAVGSSTITVASVSTPDKSVSVELTSKEPLTQDDYENILLNNTFFHDSIYGYTLTMNFSDDGTGSCVMFVKDEEKSYTDTFEYTMNMGQITFSNWSDDAYPEFANAALTETSLVAESDKTMGTYTFTLEAK